MYIAASDSGDSDSATDLRYAKAGLQWLMNVAHDTIVDDDTLYWWEQFPENDSDETYSPTWGRGAAGIGETFLIAYQDLATTSTDSSLYWHYARGAARWVPSQADPYGGGLRWPYFCGEETLVYYTYFCKGQGPIIRFFAKMYDQAKESMFNTDTSFFLAYADSGRMHLEGTKVKGYEGSDSYCWDGTDYVPDIPNDEEYTTISVSVENGPPGLGSALLEAATRIGSEESPDSAFMAIAYDCANWLKAEVHIDSVFPKETDPDPVGGYKWSWRAAEDSITIEIENWSACSDPCILTTEDVLVCSLFVHNHKNTETDSIFWWVDFLKGGNRFYFYDDSGSVTIDSGGTYTVEIQQDLSKFSLPRSANPVSVNGSVAYWLDKSNRETRYTLDQDCFRVYIME